MEDGGAPYSKANKDAEWPGGAPLCVFVCGGAGRAPEAIRAGAGRLLRAGRATAGRADPPNLAIGLRPSLCGPGATGRTAWPSLTGSSAALVGPAYVPAQPCGQARAPRSIPARAHTQAHAHTSASLIPNKAGARLGGARQAVRPRVPPLTGRGAALAAGPRPSRGPGRRVRGGTRPLTQRARRSGRRRRPECPRLPSGEGAGAVCVCVFARVRVCMCCGSGGHGLGSGSARELSWARARAR